MARDRRRAGRALGRPRPGPAGLRRDGLRRRRRAGRHDALRHPRVPPAPHADPRGDRQDPGPRRRDPAAHAAHALLRPGRTARRGLRVGLPAGGRLEGARPATAGRRARRRGQGGRLPAQRQPRLPHGARPPGGGDRRRLRRLRRGAHGPAPGARGAEARELDGEDRRAHEGGVRLGPRGAAWRRHRGHHRLARELRRDAGAAHDAGARGVRGGPEGGRGLPAAPRSQALPGRRAPAARRAARGAVGLRRERTLQRRAYDDEDMLDARGRLLRAGHRPAPRPVVPEARRRRRADAGRHDPGRPRDARHQRAADLRRRRRGLRPAQPDRGGGQRQARRALDPPACWPASARGSRSRSRSRSCPPATTACWPASSCSTARRRRPSTWAAARASPRSRPATARPPPSARRRAAWSATCRPSTTPRPACCAGRCVDVCPEYCLALVPFDALDLPEAEREGRAPRRRSGAGRRAAALGHDQGRRALHPLRALRRALPDRRHDHGDASPIQERWAAGAEGGTHERRATSRTAASSSSRSAPGRASPPWVDRRSPSLRSLVPERLLRRPDHRQAGHAAEFPDG